MIIYLYIELGITNLGNSRSFVQEHLEIPESVIWAFYKFIKEGVIDILLFNFHYRGHFVTRIFAR